MLKPRAHLPCWPRASPRPQTLSGGARRRSSEREPRGRGGETRGAPPHLGLRVVSRRARCYYTMLIAPKRARAGLGIGFSFWGRGGAAACFIRVSLMAVHEDLIRFRLLKCEERARSGAQRCAHSCDRMYEYPDRNKPTIFLRGRHLLPPRSLTGCDTTTSTQSTNTQ